jgi:hypothetical protein
VVIDIHSKLTLHESYRRGNRISKVGRSSTSFKREPVLLDCTLLWHEESFDVYENPREVPVIWVSRNESIKRLI